MIIIVDVEVVKMSKIAVHITRENLYLSKFSSATTVISDDGCCTKITLDFLYRLFTEVILSA